MSSYHFILFDLDGTLVDSSLGIVNSFQYALEKIGIHESTERLLSIIGPPIADMLKTLYPNIFVDPKILKRTIQHQRTYYRTQGVHESVLYPGGENILAKLVASKRKLFIATSKPTVFAKKILQNHHLDHYFDAIIGSHLNLTRTRKLEIIAHILKKYAKTTQNAIMIGDRNHDILAAQEHNIASIGVTYGYGSVREIQTAKPTYVANSLKELEQILL